MFGQRRPWMLLALLPWLGCGYQLLDERSVYGPEVRRIDIQIFENETLEPGFEALLGDALIEEFARRAILVPGPGSSGGAADVTLSGAVVEVELRPSAFSSVALTVEDQLLVTVDVLLRRTATQEKLWEQEGLTLGERFLSSPDPNVYESNREQALRRLSAEMAERIHDALFRKF